MGGKGSGRVEVRERFRYIKINEERVRGEESEWGEKERE